MIDVSDNGDIPDILHSKSREQEPRNVAAIPKRSSPTFRNILAPFWRLLMPSQVAVLDAPQQHAPTGNLPFLSENPGPAVIRCGSLVITILHCVAFALSLSGGASLLMVKLAPRSRKMRLNFCPIRRLQTPRNSSPVESSERTHPPNNFKNSRCEMNCSTKERRP